MTVWIGQVKEPCISSLIISYLPSQVNSLCRLTSVSSSFNQWQSQSLHRERSSCRRFAKNIIFSPSEAFYGLGPKYASNLVGKYHSILDSYRYQSFNGAGTSLAAREQILNHNFFYLKSGIVVQITYIFYLTKLFCLPKCGLNERKLISGWIQMTFWSERPKLWFEKKITFLKK